MRTLIDDARAAPVPAPTMHPPSEATLSLAFRREPEVTRLTGRAHSGPLRVQKALYPEGPACCHAVIVHPPGGVVGGDRMTISAALAPGAHALLTTPGAAKWYRANGRQSQQAVRLSAGTDAILEWLPQESIFFDGADVALRHEVMLDAGAAYIGGEILCFGRTASGERFNAGQVAQHSSIRLGGRLLWFEQGVLGAGTPAMQGPLGMGEATVCATLIAVGSGMTAALVDAIRAQCTAEAAGSVAGHAGDAGDAGKNGQTGTVGISLMKQLLVARYLGHSSAQARRMLYAVWAQVRPVIAGREAVIPRLWNT